VPDIRKIRGYTKELEVTKKLMRKKGMHAFRIPTSGSPMLPDVFAIDSYSKTVYALEVKSSTRKMIEVERKQIVRLLHFLKAFNTIAKDCVAAIALYSYRAKKWRVYVVDRNKITKVYTVRFYLTDDGFQKEDGVDFLDRGNRAELLEQLLNGSRKGVQA